MTRRLLLILASLSLPASAAEFDAAAAINQTGLDLYRQLAAKNPAGNLVLSPYSIETALALAYAGADGTTRQEMFAALHFPADKSALQKSLGSLRLTLEKTMAASGIEWHAANRLYGQRGYEFRDSFLKLMKDEYAAPFEPVDFRREAEAARGKINTWVADQTRRKIKNLIPRGALNDRSRLVLVNALYLKAPWDTPFKSRMTKSQPFALSHGESHSLPTMQRTGFLGYAREDGYVVVSSITPAAICSF